MFATNAARPDPAATKYRTHATPITTQAQFDVAHAAGARFEYTCCADGYNAVSGQPGVGWIDTEIAHRWIKSIEAGRTVHRLRAFYPVDNHQRYMAAAAAQRDEE